MKVVPEPRSRPPTDPRRRHWLRWGSATFVSALFVLSAMAVASAAPVTPLGPTVLMSPAASHGGASATAPRAASAATPAAPTRAAAPHPAGSPTYIENGTGQFFNNSAVQNVTTGHTYCASYFTYFKYCWNATLEPSLNISTHGYTGMAYTIWTNDSPCAAMAGNASTEIGFVSSTNFGSTWGTPQVMGNPVCTSDSAGDENYSSAAMPSLTSLANGTFVLTYVELNASAKNYYFFYANYPGDLGCYYTMHNRIVVTESYNNGSTWTTPHVIQQADESTAASYGCANPGFALERPSITAIGQTVYLAYTEYPYYFNDYGNYTVNYEAFLHLVVSTNGGSTWANASVPPTITEFDTSPAASIALYPNLLVEPNGTLFMSYATAYGENIVCGTYCTYVYNSTIMVAWSSNNGTSFNTTEVTQNATFFQYYNVQSEFLSGPWTQLGYSSVTKQMYLVFQNTTEGNFCVTYNPNYAGYCNMQAQADVLFANSPNGGFHWNRPRVIDPGFVSPGPTAPANNAMLPSMAVTPTGQVDLTYSTENDGVCGTNYCGAFQQFFTTSTNNGTNWSQPALVDDVYNYSECAGCIYGIDEFLGVQSSILVAGGQTLLAWPNMDNGIYGYAYWGGYGAMNVETSRLYTGPSITVSWTETGLPTGAVWSVYAGGYFRDGPTGVALSLSGVPKSFSLAFYFPWVNTSYGISWVGTGSPTSPASFTTSSSIAVAYTEQFLVNVETQPSLQSYYWQFAYTNYGMTPNPGRLWVAPATTTTLTVSTRTAALCYPCLNLSWVGWIGAGGGSTTSSSLSITVTPTGPVNETATFTINGYCYIGKCQNYTYAQTFVESGLPLGTGWGVTIDNPNGTIQSVTGNSATLSLNVSTGITSWTAWTIPSSTAGEYWVPSASAASTFVEPNGPIVISYTLGSVSNLPVNGWVQETGLPNGTTWEYQVGSVQSSASIASAAVTTFAGVSETLNASAVYYENGTGFYVSGISVQPLVANASSSTLSPGGTTTIDGPAVITFQYSEMFLVTPTSSAGGGVSPGAQWVPLGKSVTFNATADPGYHFVSWTGSGPGSASSGTSTSISFKPIGPVTEFATFRTNFLPTWNVTLTAMGLPSGTPFTLVLGGTTYSSFGTIRIGNLSSGTYAVSAPTISANASNTTQFVPTGVTSTAGLTGGILNLTQDVTLTVSYLTQYALSVFATPGGSIAGYPSGTYWVNASSSVSLTAVADPGYYLVGWSGTVASTALTVSVPINGVSNETAQFLIKQIPPAAVFSLTIMEQGLPSGLAWSVSAGNAGSSGSGSSLVISGLNGTYTVSAATLFPSTGVRWVSNVSGLSTAITSNRSLVVKYWEQFQVIVGSTAGGTATPATEWVNASGTVTLTAAPNATSTFVGWNGTGAGSYSGTLASTTVTVTGPITEQASFAPKATTTPGKSTNSGNSNGETMTILITVALLVAGLVVGLLVGRRRPPTPSSAPPQQWSGPAAPAEAEAPMTPMPEADAPAPAIYDEGPPNA